MKKTFNVMGVVAGAIFIIFAIIMLTMDTETSYVSSYTYGADFYTNTQNAVAAAANNIDDLCGIIQKGFGFVLLAMGIFSICLFGGNLAEDKEKDKVENPIKAQNFIAESETNENNMSQDEAINKTDNDNSLNKTEPVADEKEVTDNLSEKKIIEELKAAKIKLDNGEITADEFNQMKIKLLGQSRN